MKNARQIAAEALLRVDRGGYSQLVLDAALQKSELSAQERQFAAALFYGTLERRVTLDHCIAHYARHPLSETVAVILREAFYQLMYLDSVPAHAAVDEAVNLTRAMRQSPAAGMVNGILRSFLRDECKIPPVHGPAAAHLAVSGSCCEDLADCLITWYGYAAAKKILAASFGRAPVFLRVNTLRTEPDALISRLAEEGCATEKTDLPNCLAVTGDAAHTNAHAEGLFHIQDMCSQTAALTLGAQPGERVLDLCAAPGSKSFTIAEEMGSDGRLLACDISAGRLRQAEKNAARLGISIIKVRKNDASKPNPAMGIFDRVLCDVPCSGLGVLRRKPEIKLRGRDTFARLPQTQSAIIANAAEHVRPGGTLVYSTCTINPAENEDIVNAFLAAHTDFSPYPFDGDSWYTTHLPDEKSGDGFFISRMRRNA